MRSTTDFAGPDHTTWLKVCTCESGSTGSVAWGDSACEQPETAAHLLEFDTVHGRWDQDIQPEGDAIWVDGKRVSFSTCPLPGDVPWKAPEIDVDIVVECSGKFRTPELLQP